MEHLQIVVNFEGEIDEEVRLVRERVQIGFFFLGTEVVDGPLLLPEFVGIDETLNVAPELVMVLLFLPRKSEFVQIPFVVGFLEVENGLPAKRSQLLAVLDIGELLKRLLLSVLEHFVLSLNDAEKDLALVDLLVKHVFFEGNSLGERKAVVHLPFPHDYGECDLEVQQLQTLLQDELHK